MAQRNYIQDDMYNLFMRKKEWEKLQNDTKVKTKYFCLGDYILLQNSTPHLEKLTKQWCKLFTINSFDIDYTASYIFKTLDRKLAPNMHHGDHLSIFCLWKRYLQSADEVSFEVTYNLRFRNRKN